MIAKPAALALVLGACGGLRGPGAAIVQAVEVGRAGGALTGVAGDGATVFAALTARPQPRDAAAPATTTTATTTVEALRPSLGGAPLWHAGFPGFGGPLAVSGGLVLAAVGGSGATAGLELRGEPGAAVVALQAATGAVAWQLAVDATQWSVIAAIAPISDGAVVGGSFAGTLRVADKVVSSAGKADGFVARVTRAGGVAWLVRVGGPGADAVQGVAAAGDRIAIAGTFAAGAELLGQPLAAFDERSPYADGFVAELDGAGGWRWLQTFGGKEDESVAGVAIDAHGRIAIAATVRDTVHVGGVDHVASGPADGLVAWWTPDGVAGTATLIGGSDFDGLRAIAAAGDHILVAGFYSGVLRLGARTLTAGGGDDAFVAELDAGGTVVEAWPISGEGREEVTALSASPGGFVAAVAHTAAATLGTGAVPAPRDPMSGAAIMVRAVR